MIWSNKKLRVINMLTFVKTLLETRTHSVALYHSTKRAARGERGSERKQKILETFYIQQEIRQCVCYLVKLSMDRIITTYGAYIHAPSSSVTTPASQFDGINNYQSAPPLRHLPIPPEHSLQGNTNNNNGTMINTPLTYSPSVSQNSYLAHGIPSPNYQTTSPVNGFHNQNLNPIPLPPSNRSPPQTPSVSSKSVQNSTAEKKRWNTADFRWMFTKRNGSIGEFK